MSVKRVVARVHEDAGAYGINFPDFPGAVSGGASADEAVARGCETLAFHIAGMIEDGDAIPPVRSLSEMKADLSFQQDAEGGAIVLLAVDIPEKPITVNISVDETLLERIDEAAARANQSRSAFLIDAARSRLGRTV